jgi:hypothetical protein
MRTIELQTLFEPETPVKRHAFAEPAAARLSAA